MAKCNLVNIERKHILSYISHLNKGPESLHYLLGPSIKLEDLIWGTNHNCNKAFLFNK